MNSLRILAMTFAGLAALSINVAADTQAFKCTAEDGKVSYLDTRPATGCVTIEIVRVNVGKGSSSEATAEGNSSATGNDKDSKDSKSDASFAKDLAEKKEQIKKECEAKKANLKTVKTRAYVQVKDEEGKLKTLSAEEMVNMAKELQGYIDNFCTP